MRLSMYCMYQRS